ncbi:MAG: hypothetical protein ABW072_06765 [Sedimenticola sp.]
MAIKSDLNFKKVLAGQAALALAEETRRIKAPVVLQALIFELGHHGRDLARQLGVSPPTLSNWLSGRHPIPQHHHDRLLALLQAAIEAAENVIAHAPSDDGPALPSYRLRIDRAKVLSWEAIDANR